MQVYWLIYWLIYLFKTDIFTSGGQDIHFWNKFPSSLTLPQSSSRNWEGSTKTRYICYNNNIYQIVIHDGQYFKFDTIFCLVKHTFVCKICLKQHALRGLTLKVNILYTCDFNKDDEWSTHSSCTDFNFVGTKLLCDAMVNG